jgi:predicted AAA+ superfamily ATPase
LSSLGDAAIIDEAQRVPELFSYLQDFIDASAKTGRYLLSGSQNFLMMEKITQSLAGRVGILRLLPFSHKELATAKLAPVALDEWLFTGGYPRIYDRSVEPTLYYADYTETYVERDVRTISTIENLDIFIRFTKLCAGRIGQLINYQSLANECGISVKTVRSWLSILEASYVIFLLQPYYRNYNKRLIKSPKLYFHDTGLACYLLGLTSGLQLKTHYLRGELFENMVINEYLKQCYNAGVQPHVYFWRDSNKNEVDLLFEQDGELNLCEIKPAKTMNHHFFDALAKLGVLANVAPEHRYVVYGGTEAFSGKNGSFIPWQDFV